jgi:hypothetical protein
MHIRSREIAFFGQISKDIVTIGIDWDRRFGFLAVCRWEWSSSSEEWLRR